MSRKTSLLLLVCGSMAIAACDEAALSNMTAGLSSGGSSGSTSATAKKTSAEIALEKDVQSLNKQTSDIVVSNTIQGALAGAAAGCLFARSQDSDCVRGAAAGGLIGGLLGNSIGQEAAQAQRDIVSSEETVARLQNVNNSLNGIETDLNAVIRSQNSEIASLRRQLEAGQVSQSAVDARIAAINSNRQTIANGLAQSEQNVASERVKLVNAEQQSGQPLTNSKRAADSTSSRLRSLRSQVRQVSS